MARIKANDVRPAPGELANGKGRQLSDTFSLSRIRESQRSRRSAWLLLRPLENAVIDQLGDILGGRLQV